MATKNNPKKKLEESTSPKADPQVTIEAAPEPEPTPEPQPGGVAIRYIGPSDVRLITYGGQTFSFPGGFNPAPIVVPEKAAHYLLTHLSHAFIKADPETA